MSSEGPFVDPWMCCVLQEFCLFAVVGLVSDFFLQMFFFTTVLSIDIRRMEVGDGREGRFSGLTFLCSGTRTAHSWAFHCVTEREQVGLRGAFEFGWAGVCVRCLYVCVSGEGRGP